MLQSQACLLLPLAGERRNGGDRSVGPSAAQDPETPQPTSPVPHRGPGRGGSNTASRRSRHAQAGWTRLKLVIVVILIALFFLIAFDQWLPLRGQAEGAGVQQTIGTMQAALGHRVAAQVIRQGMDSLPALDRSNPVDLLLDPPRGYQGSHDRVDPATLAPGSWVFDRGRGVLVYRVRYDQYFQGSLMNPPRGEWRVVVQYDGARDARNIRGVQLMPLAETAWRFE